MSGGSRWLVAGILVAAVILDVLLLWIWRLYRSRRDLRSTRPPADSHAQGVPRWLESGVDRTVRLLRSTRSGAVHLMEVVREVLPRDDPGRLRLSIVVACLLLNASIGYAYAERSTVEGWQLWTWILTIVLAFLCLWSGRQVRLSWGREGWILLGLTIAALALRAASLGTIPPGLHGDESRMAEITLDYVFRPAGDTLNPFRTGLYSQPTLFHYLEWASMRIFGETTAALRFPGAVAGTLAVPFTYLAISQISGRHVGIISAVLLTAYHYHIHWSRIALNNIWDTLWIPAMVGLFVWSWRSESSGAAVLSGLALGLSQYFYAGSKLGIPLLAYAAFILWRSDRDGRRLLVFSTKALAMAGVVAAPLMAFAIREPGHFMDRFLTVLYWKPGLEPGLDSLHLTWLEAVWDQLFRAIAGFTSLIDTTGFYHPTVPLVMGLAAPLLLAGTLWAVFHREFMPVIWIGLTMFFGGFLLTATPGSSHYVTGIPAVVWLVALTLDAIRRLTRPWLAWASLVLIVSVDLIYYFAVFIPLVPHPDLNMPFPGR